MVLAPPGTNGHTPTVGFQLPGRTVVLTFAEDTEYAGAVVRCRGKVPLRDALRMKLLGAALSASEDDSSQLEEAARLFAEVVLISWNLVEPQLDEDGSEVLDADGAPVLVPVPVTAESVLNQPLDFVLRVIDQWAAAVMSVPSPLPDGSASGEPSAVPLEATEAS